MTGQQMLRLRPYQREAIDSVYAFWADSEQGNRPAVVLPTGMGKTVVFSHMIAEEIQATGERVIVLVHRDELADQAIRKIQAVAPGLDVGKVKADDDEITKPVMVCSVQTISRAARMNRLLDTCAFAGPVGLVVIDECHHATAVSYRNVMAALGCYAGTRTVGFTATLARGDGQGLGDVWNDVAYTKSILWGIANGFLVDPVSKMIDIEGLDLSGVKRSGGDYSNGDLGRALLENGIHEVLPKVIAEHAVDRRSIMVFTPTVAVAQETTAELVRQGVPADYVSGKTPREDRLLIYKRFERGELRVLVNCMVLTEGADFPFADCAIIARPTRSAPLFIQMVGRVLRPSPATGKHNAVVLVIAGEGGKLCTLIDLEPQVPNIEDGESLAQAYEREEARKEQRTRAGSLRFQLKHRDLDIFSASPAYQWLRTRQGVQFIPTGGQGDIALWPSRAGMGLWDVIRVPEPRGRWERLHQGVTLGIGMGWAESEADERASFNTGKAASWRKRPATDKQLAFATRLGYAVEQGMKAGEVGDMISIALTSERIDPYVKAVD